MRRKLVELSSNLAEAAGCLCLAAFWLTVGSGYLLAASPPASPGDLNSPQTANVSTPLDPSATPPEQETPTTSPANEDIYKNMSLEELMNQDVTSVSKEPQPLLDAPAAIQIITNDEIRRSGAVTLPEALRLADNLEVAQDNAHDWNISARGFNTGLSNKLLVLMDGRTVYTPLFSGVIWDVQNVMLEDLDRIEVISGPGGTLWGANAVNGVINIISKSAEETQGWYAEALGGTQPQDAEAIRYGGTIAPNVFYRVYGLYFDQNNEVYANGALRPGGTPANDSWSQGKGGFRIDTGGPSDDKFTLQGDYYNGAANEPLPQQGVQVQSGYNTLGRWTHTVSSDQDLNLQAYYDRTNITAPELAVANSPPGILSDDLDTYDIQFQHHIVADERNNVTWGLGYRYTHDAVGNSPSVQIFPSTLNQSLYNTFIQDEVMIRKDLYFTFGTKVEHNDFTGFEVEPSARIRWNVTPKQMIWAAVSRAVRTPSRLDEGLVEPTNLNPFFHIPTLLEGSTSFQSETLIAYELGYRARLTDKISTSVSAYYNDYSKIRSTTPIGTPATFDLPIQFQNNLEGATDGVELTADYQMLDWWRWHAGYDFLQENIHVKPGETDFTNGNNETADPKHQFSIRSSMDIPENIEFDTALRYVDDLPINNGPTEARVPSYFELDARLAWHPTKNLELSIVGQNLLHNYHAEYGFPQTSPTVVQQEGIQRSVYGKIAWHF